MTYAEMLKIAKGQSAIDCCCDVGDFDKDGFTVVLSEKSDKARAYLSLPHLFDITSYGKGVVASVSPELYDIAVDYVGAFPNYRAFETPSLSRLSESIEKFGLDVCFMAEYWLPRPERLTVSDCGLTVRVLEKGSFEGLYTPLWRNALCEKRKRLDMLCVGAYDGDELVGLSGASADCEEMWQIGIDVLPEYRERGIASALTATLSLEIIKRGKVPFYCCAWSNIASARNAIRAGFTPAYAEVSVKKKEFINELLNV